MTRWFTSDTHFGHANIVKFQPNRGTDDVNEMNEQIIAVWNALVAEDDEVFHLGDAALGPYAEWTNIFKRLNGHKILIIGNHDRIFADNSWKQQQKFITYYNRMFDDYYDNLPEFELADDTLVNLSHFPYDGDHFDGDRFTEYRLNDDGIVLLHGHTHSTKIVSYSLAGTLQVHVGWDAWGRPVSEQEIIELIKAN